MSRLVGKFIYNSMTDTERNALSRFAPKVRYLKGSGMFEFVCFSLSMFRYDADYPQPVSVKVDENTLLAMINFSGHKKVWTSPTEWEEDVEFYEKEEDARKAEMDEINYVSYLDSDSYLDLCLLQYYYCISNELLIKVRSAFHRYKLGRAPSIFVRLVERDFSSYSNRGRKKGALGLSDAERERIEGNVANEDAIVSRCVSLDRFELFMDFYREKCKLTGEVFKRNETKKRFVKLREEWRKNKEE